MHDIEGRDNLRHAISERGRLCLHPGYQALCTENGQKNGKGVCSGGEDLYASLGR